VTSPNTQASGSGVAAGKPQPQTTVEPSGGPFLRHTHPGRRPLYQTPGLLLGGLLSQALVTAPGYYRSMRLRVTASGGTGTVAVPSADAPFNLASLVSAKDSFATPLLVAPGYEAFYLLPKYGGAFGRGATRDVTNLQSNLPVQTNGNFQFSTQIPFEFLKAYGVLSGANASLLPTLVVNFNAAATIYSTPPTTSPTVQVINEADFYWLPQGANTAPPGIGTTRQILFQQCNPTIGSGSTTTVQLPRLGGYVDFIILELRDSTGARIDAWPSRLRIIVDGIPEIDSDINTFLDDMQIWYENTSRPVGVLAWSRKTSLSQVDEGMLDTGEQFISTNPGTQIEVQGAPWGAIVNAPASLNVLVGQIVPAGPMVQGLPEL
jgi:hypothetical protein